MQPTVQQIHEVEQKLAHDLEHPEIHDLRFVVRKLREAVVQFRAGVDLETRAVRFPWLQLKARHTARSLNAERFLVGRALDIESPAPNDIGLPGKGRQQRRKKLIAHCNPFRARDVFLIKGSRGALPKAKKTAAAPEPAYIDAFCFSGEAP